MASENGCTESNIPKMKVKCLGCGIVDFEINFHSLIDENEYDKDIVCPECGGSEIEEVK